MGECGLGITLQSANYLSLNLNKPKMYQGYESRHFTISNNVWIGAGMIILSNERIGDSAIFDAGSMVSEFFSANQVISVTPAKMIKERR